MIKLSTKISGTASNNTEPVLRSTRHVHSIPTRTPILRRLTFKYSIHVHTRMGTTTISLKDEAYEQLKAEKRETESFSDVVLRLTATADTEERIEELENKDLEDVNLDPVELEEYKDC